MAEDANMHRPILALVLLFSMTMLAFWPGGSRCPAGEPAPPLDAVLAKWQEASGKVRILDAELRVFDYTNPCRDQPTVRQGRFYYESPNLGRYEIRKSHSGNVNDWFALSEVLVWNDGVLLYIDPERRTCTKLPLKRPKEAESPFGPFWASLFLPLRSPGDFVPLVVDINAAKLRERFDIAITEQVAEQVFLKAVPKHKPNDPPSPRST